jgi:CheY-like chemotaxis protein
MAVHAGSPRDEGRWRVCWRDGRQPSALVVEDSPDVLETIGAFLTAAGFHVVAAGSGSEALVCLASDQSFDLLVTDYAMPGLNGVGLAIRALQRYAGLKVLMITGMPGARGLAEIPPGVALLVKPFRRDALIAQLQGWFEPEHADLARGESADGRR